VDVKKKKKKKKGEGDNLLIKFTIFTLILLINYPLFFNIHNLFIYCNNIFIYIIIYIIFYFLLAKLFNYNIILDMLLKQ